MRTIRLTTLTAVLALAACGGGEQSSRTSATTAASTGSGNVATESTASVTKSAPKQLGTIVDSGFGQEKEYVWVTALVHNNSTYVGQTVTVNFNVLDGAGNILKSESQVENFYAPEADHAVGTQVSLKSGEKAASVEATVDVEASGAFSDKPFPTMPTTKPKIEKDEYGGAQASFTLTNPLSVAVKSPRVGVICQDSAGKIVGGGSSYPDLVPAGGKIRVDTRLLISGTASECAAYPGAPTDWDGEGQATSESSSADTAAAMGSAEDAFKTWVEQFSDKDWKAQYQSLVSAQQDIISEKEYLACRGREATPALKWGRVLSVVDAAETPIPGTKVKLQATKVSAEVISSGLKIPVDAHMVDEDGQWKWMMTEENVAGCGAK